MGKPKRHGGWFKLDFFKESNLAVFLRGLKPSRGLVLIPSTTYCPMVQACLGRIMGPITSLDTRVGPRPIVVRYLSMSDEMFPLIWSTALLANERI